jgi:uncharacterized protein (TIGR03435 family)
MIGTLAILADLTLMLSRQLERPVFDKTGLSGKYDFQLTGHPISGPPPPKRWNPPKALWK